MWIHIARWNIFRKLICCCKGLEYFCIIFCLHNFKEFTSFPYSQATVWEIMNLIYKFHKSSKMLLLLKRHRRHIHMITCCIHFYVDKVEHLWNLFNRWMYNMMKMKMLLSARIAYETVNCTQASALYGTILFWWERMMDNQSRFDENSFFGHVEYFMRIILDFDGILATFCRLVRFLWIHIRMVYWFLFVDNIDELQDYG